MVSAGDVTSGRRTATATEVALTFRYSCEYREVALVFRLARSSLATSAQLHKVQNIGCWDTTGYLGDPYGGVPIIGRTAYSHTN
jgi:hypothetical protein